MFIKYQTIRDFDNYLLNDQSFPQNYSKIYRKQNVLKETQDNSSQIPQLLPKTRSLKLKTLLKQTSFHNKFLHQHVECLKTHFKLYQQKCYPQLKNCTLTHQINQIFGNDLESNGENEKLKELLKNDGKFFELNQKMLFQLDLFYEEGLHEFLSQICAKLPSQIALELCFVANLFWKAYVGNSRTEISLQEIKVVVSSVLESEQLQNFMGNALFLNFRKANHASVFDEGKTVENLKSFLKIYGFTILMVIQQYFSNPFCQGQQAKQKTRNIFEFRDISNDEFSDEENEIQFHMGNKKRKF